MIGWEDRSRMMLQNDTVGPVSGPKRKTGQYPRNRATMMLHKFDEQDPERSRGTNDITKVKESEDHR